MSNSVKSYDIEIVINNLQRDSSALSHRLINENDDKIKKNILKQLVCINSLNKALTTYNNKFLQMPVEEIIKEVVVEKVVKEPKSKKLEKTNYNIKSMIN